MDKQIKSWLSDIEQAISEIYQFLPDQIDFEAFQRDLKTKRAIERNIEIIGEAMSRILKIKADFKDEESFKDLPHSGSRLEILTMRHLSKPRSGARKIPFATTWL